MTEVRELRWAADLSQHDFAALMSVPVNTFHMWDSGLRPVPTPMLLRAQATAARHARQTEFLPLVQLAGELGVHVRTLQAAVRTGRLAAHFSVQSVFGRPRRLATRAAAEQFMATTADSAGKRNVRLPCQPSRVTITGNCALFVVVSNSRKTAWPDASARLEKPSSTSGNRGRERRHPSSGNGFYGLESGIRCARKPLAIDASSKPLMFPIF